MTSGLFKVIFRGELADGHSPDHVRARLAERFRMPEDRIDALFSGRPVVVKRGVDEAAARRLAQAFLEAGAVCEVDRTADEGAAAATPERPEPSGPAGENAPSTHAHDDPNRTIVPLAVPTDLSGLRLDEADTYTPAPDETPPPDIDTGGLRIVDDEGPLEPGDPTAGPPDIDISGLELVPAETPADADRRSRDDGSD